MKRDLLFIAEPLLPLQDDRRLEIIGLNRGLRSKEGEPVSKVLASYLRKADENTLGRFIVESIGLLAAAKQSDSGKVLRAAAETYKVDADAIALKVKQEFAVKEKAKAAAKTKDAKTAPRLLKKPA